eukprot:TRINITY_DN10884_c0_g1_i1.p1 TRINITY_DN10884_c0_g1~~TRINITY_DN10884_c0_g1_i1.p1  ORF type:complete len:108 (-),score=45.90 TRINITY_DN10884_c0_g1_i1:68-391(-)
MFGHITVTSPLRSFGSVVDSSLPLGMCGGAVVDYTNPHICYGMIEASVSPSPSSSSPSSSSLAVPANKEEEEEMIIMNELKQKLRNNAVFIPSSVILDFISQIEKEE